MKARSATTRVNTIANLNGINQRMCVPPLGGGLFEALAAPKWREY
jgi:hypothetical protein